MGLNWPEILKAALIYGAPVLIIGIWAANRRKARKENDRTSEVLRTKTR